MTIQTPDLKALAQILAEKFSYRFANDKSQPNAFAFEVAAALRAAPDAGKCDDPLCPETSCDLCSTPSAPEASGAEPVAMDAGERIRKLAVELTVAGWHAGDHGIDEKIIKKAERSLLEFACDEIKRHLERTSPPPADMRGTEGAPIGYVSQGTLKALNDPHGAGPVVACAGYDTTVPVYATPPVADAGIAAPPEGDLLIQRAIGRQEGHDQCRREVVAALDSDIPRQSVAASPTAGYRCGDAGCMCAPGTSCAPAPPAASADAVRDDLLDWLETEVMAIDHVYRGSPPHDHHDAYWMKSRVYDLINKARALSAPVAGADASPSAMRERADGRNLAQELRDEVASIYRNQNLDGLLTEAADEIDRLRTLSPDAGVGMPSTDTPS